MNEAAAWPCGAVSSAIALGRTLKNMACACAGPVSGIRQQTWGLRNIVSEEKTCLMIH